MAQYTLQDQDLVGGLQGFAHRKTGNAGNAFRLQQINKLNPYEPLRSGQTINIPDELTTNAPALDPFAESVAQSLPTSKLATNGIPTAANPAAVSQDKNFMDLAGLAANQIFSPYYTTQAENANNTLRAKAANETGTLVNNFNNNNTLDSSMAGNALGQAARTQGVERRDVMGNLQDQYNLAIAQEVADRVSNEQDIRNNLLNGLVNETVMPGTDWTSQLFDPNPPTITPEQLNALGLTYNNPNFYLQ